MSGTHGLLPDNQPGYFYITLEESYVTMFKLQAERWFKEHKQEEGLKARLAHAVAKAYISDVLHNLSNTQFAETGSEKNIWVFLSFPELERRLHGACKMRVLKDAMKEMIDDGYVYKRPNRNPAYKALEYRLNLTRYRTELNALPKKSDEIESANMHDDSADLHDDDANMHDGSADSHARLNIEGTKTKERPKEPSVTPTASQPEAPSPTHASFSREEEKREQPQRFTGASKAFFTPEELPEAERHIHEWFHASAIAMGEKGKITPQQREHYSKLAPDVPTEHAFTSLIAFTREYLESMKKGTTIVVYLKNLVNSRQAWKQTYKPPVQNGHNGTSQGQQTADAKKWAALAERYAPKPEPSTKPGYGGVTVAQMREPVKLTLD